MWPFGFGTSETYKITWKEIREGIKHVLKKVGK